MLFENLVYLVVGFITMFCALMLHRYLDWYKQQHCKHDYQVMRVCKICKRKEVKV
jgi:hypothetical protein